MAVWTITYDAGSGPVEKAAADWGLTADPVIRTRDRSETVVRFRMAGAAPEGAIPFPFQAKVVIRQNRTLVDGSWTGTGYVFTGYQTTQKGHLSGNKQGINLEFADAIWLMKNTTFQQIWKVNAVSGGGVVSSTLPVSRCILFMDINSFIPYTYNVKSVQWEINEILTYAGTCGIAIAAGTIDYSGFYINYTHVRAISIWDALLKCLEIIPDAKVWIDGSATTPTLNVRTRANLAAMSAPTGTGPGPLSLVYRGADSAGRKHFSSDLTPRYDLIPSQVVLQYQINNTVNGKPAPSWEYDVYPGGSTGETPFAMVCPIDLTGTSKTVTTGQLDCEPLLVAAAQTGHTLGTLADHNAKRAWWSIKRGGEQTRLADYRVRFQDTSSNQTYIGDATVVDDTGNPIDLTQYPNRLVKGTYHAWMMNGSTQINAVRAKITVRVEYAEYDVVGVTPADTDTNGNIARKAVSHELHCHVVLTNSPAGITPYTTTSIGGAGETPVTGLAENIYNSRATLDYDGTHEIVDAGNAATPALSQIIGPWNVINFTGGATAWATANMTVAGSEIDLRTNHQRIDIGPSKHLAPQDWNELLQFFRYRRAYISPGVRATGYGDPNDTVDMAHNTPDANTVEGLEVNTQTQEIDYLVPGAPGSGFGGAINSDAGIVTSILGATTPTPVVDATGMKTMQPREMACCDNTGNVFYAIVHVTSGHTKPS